MALYLFDEGGGPRAEDTSRNRHHVIIPEIYQAVHRQILIPPWKDLAYDGPDYQDIVVNVLGFMPFGFCFFFHYQQSRPHRRAKNILLVIVVGSAISLAIELTQAWLPNRDSSMIDVITNIAGTFLGAVLALPFGRKVITPELKAQAQ